MKNNSHEGGFIKLIILLVIVLIVLGYFGLNVQTMVNSSGASANLHYVWGLVVSFWNNYLYAPVAYVWNKVVIGLIWNNLLRLTQ